MALAPATRRTIEHLKDLTDEVRQFHPVLSLLLRKLPNVIKVDYTHGGSELGADFIVHRLDSTLAKTDHIGVVAKLGTIRTDHADVFRQIEECLVSRKSVDGKDNIQMREVWVVSTGGLTQNAKDKIQDKFAKTKVEFVVGEQLAQLIDRYAPQQFIVTPPRIQKYIDESLHIIATDDSNSLFIPGGGDSFYIEPEIEQLEYDAKGMVTSKKRLGNFESLVNKVKTTPFVLIEGSMGIGKSKLGRELFSILLRSDEVEREELFPILMHCVVFQKNYEFVAEKCTQEYRNKFELGANTKVIIIIDGFDEVDLPDEVREGVIRRMFSDIANEKNLGIVILSRPLNESQLLGAKIQSLDILRLKQLKGQRAIQFLAKIGGQLDVSARIIKDIQQSRLFLSLEGTPIAFMLLGRLIAQNHHDVPSNLTELFQKYLELVLGRWEIQKGLRSQVEYEVAIEALSWLGDYMMTHELHEVARSEFHEHIETYRSARNLSVDAGMLIEKLAERSSVLFIRREADTVSFRHRSFCEFFFAKQLAKNHSITLTERVFFPYWSNSYFFLAGNKRDCPELIEQLTALPLDSDAARVARAFNFGNFLLAAYLTPMSVTKAALVSVFADLSRLYISVYNRSVDSVLSGFTIMQLLCAFASLSKDQYGYSHFKDVLGECIFEFEDMSASDENAIALFLLDVAYKEAGGDLRFDELIERYGEQLPISVRLGVTHEAKLLKSTSDGVKRMERNLRRSLRAHGDTIDSFVQRLYATPIAQLTIDGGADGALGSVVGAGKSQG